LLWLGVVTLLAVLFSAVLLAFFGATFSGDGDSSWIENGWQSLLRVMDSGTMAGDVGWTERLLALLITLFGILVAGTLIGLIASAVEQRVAAMRRGRSIVVESDHIVILGASARLPVVIEQLAIAQRKRRSQTIAVLADTDPAELGDEVRTGIGDVHGVRLVFRRGDPTRVSDLAIVAVRSARTVIVLADEDARGDAGVMKAVLAVGAQLDGFDRVPIVAELSDPGNADILVRTCGGAVEAVVASQTVAQLTAFALREPGLSEVVMELVDFRGCDVYVRDMGDLAGGSFGECVFRFAKVRPIGVMRANGDVELNPSSDTRLDPSDRLIIIADDDVRSSSRGADTSLRAAVPPPGTRERVDPAQWPIHLVIIGWNALGIQLLTQLDPVATSGSSAEIVYDPRLFNPEELNIPETDRIDVTLTPSSSAVWQIADRVPSTEPVSVVLLGYRRGVSVEDADGRTLLELMVLRRELETRGAASTRLIVELLDAQNVELARVMGADDYVVSDAIASRLIAQVAEQPARRAVLRSLYATEGASVHLAPAEGFGLRGRVTFADIIAAVYAKGQLAIGWRRNREVVLNPRTSEQVELTEGDQIVIIA
jgi:voltage-gated potassium channel Kch/K+/H+ antiporter YhaU regulatory subunit KhtT